MLKAHILKKRVKQLIPAQATSIKKVCALPRDNISTVKSWFLIDPAFVYIHNQKSGGESTGKVTLTRAEFKKFAEWYFGVDLA